MGKRAARSKKAPTRIRNSTVEPCFTVEIEGADGQRSFRSWIYDRAELETPRTMARETARVVQRAIVEHLDRGGQLTAVRVQFGCSWGHDHEIKETP